jgi:hypothetical protein
MPRRFTMFCFVAVSALFCAACSKGPTEDDGTATAAGDSAAVAQSTPSDSKESTQAAEPSNGELKSAPPRIERDSLTGRWILVLSRQSFDFYALLLDVTTEADAYQAKLESASAVIQGGNPKLAEANITDSEVHLVFDVQGEQLDFRGTFLNGEVRGTVVFGPDQCDPARLIATNETTLEDYNEPRSGPERDDFVKAAETLEVQHVRTFTKTHPSSPLSLLLFDILLMQAADQDFGDDELSSLAADYLKSAESWGPRMVTAALVQTGTILAEHNRSAELAIKSLEQAQSRLTDGDAAGWEYRIAIAKAQIQLAGDDPAAHEQAENSLLRLRGEQPLNKEVTSYLAKLAQKQGQTDRAIEFYAELAALPMTMQEMAQRRQASMPGAPSAQQPMAVLAELWHEKHGNTDGLGEFLNTTYAQRIYSFADQPADQPATGNRTVLCELLTGALCPPCVSADVATGGIETTFPRSNVIVLRYHQHVPGPDPTANPHSEARMSYYGAQGTPAVYVNGSPIPGLGGLLENSVDNYNRLRGVIEPLLSQQTDIRLNVSAEAKDGELTVSAEAVGIEQLSDDLRLRLVLAEDEIDYAAGNGIRKHEMVVRWAVGGMEGVRPQDGRLGHTETLNLGEFKQSLLDSLIDFESNVQRFQRNFRFDAKPLELKHMHLVAFVQNDKTKEILQAVAIPVSGTLEYPKVESDDASPKQEESADPSETPAAKDEEANESGAAKEADGPKLLPADGNAAPETADQAGDQP